MTDAELCHEVAVKVLGWEWRDFYWWTGDDIFEGSILSWDVTGMVIERLRERGFDFKMDNYGTQYRVMFWPRYHPGDVEDRPLFIGFDDKAPRATLKAALKAMEVING